MRCATAPIAFPDRSIELQQSADQQADAGQEQDFLRHLKQEGVKDADLGSFLDKLGGAIAGKRVSTLDSKVTSAEHLYNLNITTAHAMANTHMSPCKSHSSRLLQHKALSGTIFACQP